MDKQLGSHVCVDQHTVQKFSAGTTHEQQAAGQCVMCWPALWAVVVCGVCRRRALLAKRQPVGILWLLGFGHMGKEACGVALQLCVRGRQPGQFMCVARPGLLSMPMPSQLDRTD